MDFFEHQEVARRKSHVLVVYFLLAVAGIIAAVYGLVVLILTLSGESVGKEGALPYWDPMTLLFTAGGTGAVIFLASSFKSMQLAGGGAVVARGLGGRELDINTTDFHERRLLNLVEEMAIASGVPVPSVYVMDAEDAINAFAAGRTTSDAVIGVTRGCMTLLTRDELQGVIAHEFSHILNGDMRLNIRLMGLVFGILFLSLVGEFILRNAFRGGSSSSKKEGAGLALAMLVAGLGLLLIGYIGAFFASLVVLVPILPPDAPKPLILLAMAVMGMIGGAIWGFVPGFLKAKFAVSEIITTLMLNYVAILWNNFWIFDRWSEGGFQMTRLFERGYWLPRLADYAREYPTLSGITLHLGFVVALLAAVLVWWIFDRSRWGYEIKLIGDNPNAARYAGLNIARNIILVMMLSGALAGLAGMSEISGVVHRLQERISPQYGFTGIIIAWVAKLNPFAVILVSILFGALIVAGREIQPSGLAAMLQGIILFMVISSDVLLRYSIRLQRTTTPVTAGSDA